MEIFFYKYSPYPNDIWFTNFNGVVVAEWCAEHNVKYKIYNYDGFRTGIKLLEDKDKVYFELRWGGTPSNRIEDYID